MNKNLAAWCLSVLLCGLLGGCAGGGGQQTIPADVQGTWVTSDSMYADRFFSLDADRIVVGLGGGRSDAHMISGVRRELQDDGRVLYVVVYWSEGADQEFAFYYDARRDVVTPKNQELLEWTRKGAST